MKENWDWETKNKVIANINEWKNKFIEVREITPSPDGEKVAAIVRTDEGVTVCENGKLWEGRYDRVWGLRYNSLNQPLALVTKDYEWTVAVDGQEWENRYEFVWNFILGSDGKTIAVNVKTMEQYSVAINDVTWEQVFHQTRGLVLSPDNTKAAAPVQIEPLKEGEVSKFFEGIWSIAVNGQVWNKKFVNVWNPIFSSDSKHVAAEVRLSRTEYTIAVDGKPWDKIFNNVWEPLFLPGKNQVIAPVKTFKGWTLALDGDPIWDYFTQVWHQKVSPDGNKIAAVVATNIGEWTIAVDGIPWDRKFSDAVLEPVFSPDGRRIAAVVKESKDPFENITLFKNPDNDRWSIAVDGKRWEQTFDMIWDPIFSSDGEHIVTKAEIDGKYYVVLDGKVGKEAYEALWLPQFSPDNKKLLIRGILNGKYVRKVLSLDEI
ncbi:MAG: WD40 repeat domain-containing protein [Thermodesulfobacteriota bacterium]|nr:MAG: WD40 repeat domain-containing protein [Thermodesulfobacteriota bacterium]